MSNNIKYNTRTMITRSKKRGLAEANIVNTDMSNTDSAEPKTKFRKTNTQKPKAEVKVKTKADKVPILKTKKVPTTKVKAKTSVESDAAINTKIKETIPTRASSIDSGVGLPVSKNIPTKATFMVLPPELRIIIMKIALELYIDDIPNDIDYLDRTNTLAYQVHFDKFVETLGRLLLITFKVKALQTDFLYVVQGLRSYVADKLLDWHAVAENLREQERNDIHNGPTCCAACVECIAIIQSNYRFVEMQEALVQQLRRTEFYLTSWIRV